MAHLAESRVYVHGTPRWSPGAAWRLRSWTPVCSWARLRTTRWAGNCRP